VPESSSAADALARAFLAGEWARAGLRERGRGVFGKTPRWLARVVAEVLDIYHRPPLDRPRELARVIDAILLERRVRAIPPVRRWFTFEPEMGRKRWPVPDLVSVVDVARFVDADIGRLEWLADPRCWERSVTSEKLRHYRYSWHMRPHSVPRLIERPKPRLKQIQRRILHEILDLIPPDEAAHGFRRGRSVVTHATAHAGSRVVMRFDLEHFFASVDAGRVYGILRTAGYPESAAHVLTALCVNVVPHAAWAAAPAPDDAGLLGAHSRLGLRLASPHLPQGAPTSPALASLAAQGLDRRLRGLATRFGATYTRYADDLAFSGGRQLVPARRTIRAAVAEIVRDEGFRLNERKSRLMTSAGRQELCGVVVNAHANVARRDYDRLKAIVHNAATRGPQDLDRARLRGRIAWVESVNPARGARLREEFARIDWAA
jgi:RNA-directed DNA polymerase